LKRDYPVGTVVEATIVGMTSFGAFARIIPGIDGLIHISQIADHRIDKPQDVLTMGQTVKAVITDIDFDRHRVSLSIRQLLDNDEKFKTADESAE
ncbi:MAG TPA: bifunctional 4-hydroxy-3-methylbut-2-enyl diphosphate reductase/30S ribosomal protein S1, partial [Ruminococcaceae bacterium]|nr:bifunctional 4-hydroxy-3-methylbut-2-enyl diphosphate reductase/30S ribosomal protein S1 [Oscillospiraceae bacterium]